MVRLHLFAEGRTEQTFANTVLRPHLAEHRVYMHKAVLIANAHKKYRTHRGGGRNFHAMQKDILITTQAKFNLSSRSGMGGVLRAT